METKRLKLRPFEMSDAEAMFRNWASDPDVLRYMPYKICKDIETTCVRIGEWMGYFNSLNQWGAYAMELKSTGEVIGTIDYAETNGDIKEAEVGYQLGKAWWGMGYAAEALETLLNHCFETTNLNRIWGGYDPRNAASGRVMEKTGMLYEGTFRQWRLRNGELVDRTLYAILREDWDTKKEIEYYNNLPCLFDSFIDVPTLSNNEIYLVCTEKQPANPEKKWVPAYIFAICKNGEKIGNIGLRIGYTDSLYYGGQIAYDVHETYRGHGYAGQACLLLAPVAKAHKMEKLLITNDIKNLASKRVCEKIGAHFIREARLPEWNDLYKEGQRFSNIFEMSVQ